MEATRFAVDVRAVDLRAVDLRMGAFVTEAFGRRMVERLGAEEVFFRTALFRRGVAIGAIPYPKRTARHDPAIRGIITV